MILLGCTAVALAVLAISNLRRCTALLLFFFFKFGSREDSERRQQQNAQFRTCVHTRATFAPGRSVRYSDGRLAAIPIDYTE